jgi:hypothetical protein
MKRVTLKTAALLISTLLLSAVASADSRPVPAVYIKNGDPSVVLTIPYNGTAKIESFYGYEQHTLIDGPLTSNQKGSYEIHREEGDVCSSSARIEMYHDSVLGENAVAEVHLKFGEDSPTGDHLCGGMERIEGTYTRMKVRPLQKRCAPPANSGPAVAKCL